MKTNPYAIVRAFCLTGTFILSAATSIGSMNVGFGGALTQAPCSVPAQAPGQTVSITLPPELAEHDLHLDHRLPWQSPCANLLTSTAPELELATATWQTFLSPWESHGIGYTNLSIIGADASPRFLDAAEKAPWEILGKLDERIAPLIDRAPEAQESLSVAQDTAPATPVRPAPSANRQARFTALHAAMHEPNVITGTLLLSLLCGAWMIHRKQYRQRRRRSRSYVY